MNGRKSFWELQSLMYSYGTHILFSEKLTKINDIGFITLQDIDVVRHDVVRKIINAYEVK